MDQLNADRPQLTYLDFLRLKQVQKCKNNFQLECNDPNFLLSIKLMNKHKPIMDMGICFGLTTNLLLEKGFKVIATNESKEDLDFLWKSLSLEQKSHLVLKEFNPVRLFLERNSLSGIVSIFHMNHLIGTDVRILFDQFYHWLEPGGVLLVTCQTPYSWTFNKRCIERFAESAAKNVEWPGEFLAKDIVTDKHILDAFPERLNLFTAEILIRETIRVGLSVFKVGYFDYDIDNKKFISDGVKKDFVSIIAIKTR